MEPLCCHHLSLVLCRPAGFSLSRTFRSFRPSPSGVRRQCYGRIGDPAGSLREDTSFFPFDHNACSVMALFSLLRNVRAISIARLSMSPCVHLQPIDVVVFDGPQRDLILEPASCLDAFSTYPAQTLLPGGAPGGTTGTQEVCPTRSSRTSVGASQISYAHNR